MMSGSIPKYFLIHGTIGNSTGYLRFVSYETKDNVIRYDMTLRNSKSEASRFINLEATKNRALGYLRSGIMKDVVVVDVATGRSFYVKEK